MHWLIVRGGIGHASITGPNPDSNSNLNSANTCFIDRESMVYPKTCVRASPNPGLMLPLSNPGPTTYSHLTLMCRHGGAHRKAANQTPTLTVPVPVPVPVTVTLT